ncbi:zinc-binding dehydrogenase [Streptomyces sp. NPDC020096]
MPTVHAVRTHTRGGPEQLMYEESSRPEPGHGDALVAVRAASITTGELTWPATWTDRLDGSGRERTPTPGGVLVGIAAPPNPERAAAQRARAVFFIVEPNRTQLDKITDLIDHGQLKPMVDRVVPLPRTRAAFEALEKEHPRGKVVIQVAPQCRAFAGDPTSEEPHQVGETTSAQPSRDARHGRRDPRTGHRMYGRSPRYA